MISANALKNLIRYKYFTVKFGERETDCDVIIVIQFIIMVILFRMGYYLVVNVAAILISAIFVYILNNVWTFRQSKMKGGIR